MGKRKNKTSVPDNNLSLNDDFVSNDLSPFTMNLDGVTVTTGQRQRNVLRARQTSYPGILAVGIQRLQAPASEDPYRKRCDGHGIRPCSRYVLRSQCQVLRAQANWSLTVPQGCRLRSQTRPARTQINMGVGQGATCREL